jgi:ferritin-like metal-binding protein YciE
MAHLHRVTESSDGQSHWAAAGVPPGSRWSGTRSSSTKSRLQRLEQVFKTLDERARGKHCDGIAGIIEEGKSIMEQELDDTATDACLIAAGQRAEHYEMAA